MSATGTLLEHDETVAHAAVSAASATCRHCGSTFVPVEDRTEFCCAGCEYVHRLITGQNLDRFYQLRRGPAAPVRAVVFQARDYRWLSGLVSRAEREAATRGAGAEAMLELDVQGISCVGCVWLIERLWREHTGARSIQVNATLGRLVLHWMPGACDVVAFARDLQRFGYLTGPATKSARPESSALLPRLGLCAVFALNGMLFALPAYLGMGPDFPFARLFIWLSFLFATASVVVGGSYFFRRSWQSLRRGVLHIDLPISLGILAGLAGSIYAWRQGAGSFTYFDFVSTFTFLMLVGRWTQLAAVERNRHRLLGLHQEMPDVQLCDDAIAGRVVATKPVHAIQQGDTFVVASGEIIPVSARLVGPAGSLGMDWINGESDALAVQPGQIVASGAINLSPHELRVAALEDWSTSLLARLLAAPTPAEWRNRTLERLIRIYLVAVIAIAVAGGAAWLLFAGDVTRAMQVVVSVLVVSCPCALGVSLPLIDEMIVARLRRAGLFVRSETLWARLRRVRKVVFDKTGTLTLESLALQNRAALAALAPDARVALWTLVREARHPVAACVREAMMAGGLDDGGATGADLASAVREHVGLGLEWNDARGRCWRLGRPSWAALGLLADGAADVVLACDERLVGVFHVAEELRADAAAEVARMRRRGFDVFILSGDRAEKVAAMAARLGLPERAAVAAMTPAGKAAWMRELDRGDTLMIGDGANDSLAFDIAACRGTPAIERGLLAGRADFYFLGRGLDGIRRLFEATHRRHIANLRVLGFAITYNLAAIVLALAGLMNPLLAAVLMPASALASLGLATVSVRR